MHFIQRQCFKYWPWITEARLLWCALWCRTQKTRKAFGAWTGGRCLCALQPDQSINVTDQNSPKRVNEGVFKLDAQPFVTKLSVCKADCKGLEEGTAAHTVQEHSLCAHSLYHPILKGAQYQKDDKQSFHWWQLCSSFQAKVKYVEMCTCIVLL